MTNFFKIYYLCEKHMRLTIALQYDSWYHTCKRDIGHWLARSGGINSWKQRCHHTVNYRHLQSLKFANHRHLRSENRNPYCRNLCAPTFTFQELWYPHHSKSSQKKIPVRPKTIKLYPIVTNKTENFRIFTHTLRNWR